MATVNTSIKIDEETKKEAQKLFKDLGLSLSTAINIFLKQAIREKGIPFYVNSLPENSELAQAFEEAKQIKENPNVSFCTHKTDFSYVLSISGKATFVNDINLKTRALNEYPMLKEIFKTK